MDKKHLGKRHHHHAGHLMEPQSKKGVLAKVDRLMPHSIGSERFHLLLLLALLLLMFFNIFMFVRLKAVTAQVEAFSMRSLVQDHTIPESNRQAFAAAVPAPAVNVPPVAPSTIEHTVPPMQGCTGEDRDISSFGCPTTPTRWIIGTAPYLSCYKGETIPRCSSDMVFSCNQGGCICADGLVNCDGVCVEALDPGRCGPGTTPNFCTGFCE